MDVDNLSHDLVRVGLVLLENAVNPAMKSAVGVEAKIIPFVSRPLWHLHSADIDVDCALLHDWHALVDGFETFSATGHHHLFDVAA